MDPTAASWNKPAPAHRREFHSMDSRHEIRIGSGRAQLAWTDTQIYAIGESILTRGCAAPRRNLHETVVAQSKPAGRPSLLVWKPKERECDGSLVKPLLFRRPSRERLPAATHGYANQQVMRCDRETGGSFQARRRGHAGYKGWGVATNERALGASQPVREGILTSVPGDLRKGRMRTSSRQSLRAGCWAAGKGPPVSEALT